MGGRLQAQTIYLHVSVNVPRSLFTIVHRLHCGVCQPGDVSSCKHPALTGLHGVRVHLWSAPAVHLHRSHGLAHCTQTHACDTSGCVWNHRQHQNKHSLLCTEKLKAVVSFSQKMTDQGSVGSHISSIQTLLILCSINAKNRSQMCPSSGRRDTRIS